MRDRFEMLELDWLDEPPEDGKKLAEEPSEGRFLTTSTLVTAALQAGLFVRATMHGEPIQWWRRSGNMAQRFTGDRWVDAWVLGTEGWDMEYAWMAFRQVHFPSAIPTSWRNNR